MPFTPFQGIVPKNKRAKKLLSWNDGYFSTLQQLAGKVITTSGFTLCLGVRVWNTVVSVLHQTLFSAQLCTFLSPKYLNFLSRHSATEQSRNITVAHCRRSRKLTKRCWKQDSKRFNISKIQADVNKVSITWRCRTICLLSVSLHCKLVALSCCQLCCDAQCVTYSLKDLWGTMRAPESQLMSC